MKPFIIAAVAASIQFLSIASAQEAGFVSIFDGKSFTGWSAPEMGYWSIEDGAITATSSETNPCTHNQFLVWQGGEISNFELKLKFKIEGTEKANSGVQVRSKVEEDGHVVGYQVDITHPSTSYLGCVYDEKSPRKLLAARGTKVKISEKGERKETPIKGGASAVIADYEQGKWAEYHITFVDEKLIVKLNGRTSSVVTDLQKTEQELSGILALQLHSGPPMKVQFKDIQLKKLP